MFAIGLFSCIEDLDDDEQKTKKRKRSKKWLLERRHLSLMTLLQELESNEPADFKNYLRMENHLFSGLSNLVRHHVEKQNTVMQESISVEKRLVAILRFFLQLDAAMKI
jgi:hypothetical protein